MDMTKSEVRQVLEEHLEHWERLTAEHIATKEEGERTVEAFRLAVEALSEPNNDIISRAEAIECVRWGESVTDVIDRINALPSAENSNAKTQNSNQETKKSNGDLISRADAIEAFPKITLADIGFATNAEYRAEAIENINALPSAEAVSREEVTAIKNNYINEINELLNKIDALSAEPKTGKWVKIIDEETPNLTKWHYECDQCGAGRWEEGQRYCQNCGTRMLREDGET